MGIKGLLSNERRVAEDRRDCYWLYVVTNCNAEANLQEPIKDPARFPWHEVKKVEHYYLSVGKCKHLPYSKVQAPPLQ